MKGSPEALLRYFELVKPSAFGDSPSKALFKKPPDQPGVHPPMNSVQIELPNSGDLGKSRST